MAHCHSGGRKRHIRCWRLKSGYAQSSCYGLPSLIFLSMKASRSRAREPLHSFRRRHPWRPMQGTYLFHRYARPVPQDNVLLDADFHVQITDFGLTRHSEATATGSSELFGHNKPKFSDTGDSTARTQESDIYAFGCLFYQVTQSQTL